MFVKPSFFLNLPGWRWGSITQNPLVAVSRPLHSGVCETRQDIGLPVLHSEISDSGLLRTRGDQQVKACLRHEKVWRIFPCVQVIRQGAGCRGVFLCYCLLYLFSCLFLFLNGRASVRLGVCASVRFHVFTVAILAQGTNRGDALCAALLCNHIVSIPLRRIF